MKLVFAVVLALMSSVSLAAPIERQNWMTSNVGDTTFSYTKDLPLPIDQVKYPDRVLIEWMYWTADGMPSTAERERMDRLEERLQSAIEQPELAVLVDISTGGNEKFWAYYSKSADRFLEVMNKSLASELRFPIRVHVNYDPLWKEYNDFRKDMKESGHPPLPR